MYLDGDQDWVPYERVYFSAGFAVPLSQLGRLLEEILARVRAEETGAGADGIDGASGVDGASGESGAVAASGVDGELSRREALAKSLAHSHFTTDAVPIGFLLSVRANGQPNSIRRSWTKSAAS